MSATVGDHLLERLAANGVRRVYGYPGDGINGIMGAMNRAGGGIDGPGPLELIQVRHEEMAAFMACAHATFTGEVGVCLATSGPGAPHATDDARDVKLRRGMKASLSGTLATMGPGVPYAIAAKFAFPDRVAIALVDHEVLGALERPAVDRARAQQPRPQPGHVGPVRRHARRPRARHCLLQGRRHGDSARDLRGVRRNAAVGRHVGISCRWRTPSPS